MFAMKNRLSAQLLTGVLLVTCLGLLWLAISGFPSRRFRYAPKLSKQSIEALPAKIARTILSADGANVFDATMLIREQDRHVERLTRLEAAISGMREFLVRHVRASEHNDSRLPATLVKAREYLRTPCTVSEENTTKLSVGFLKGGFSPLAKENTIHPLSMCCPMKCWQKQNPSDCESAPKLLCLLDNPHGIAAGIHDALWCFVAALQMGRTVVLNSTLWHYAPGVDGWSRTFQPVTGPPCAGVSTKNTIVKGYPGYDSEPKERRKILDLPASIVETLVANHADPYAWWYGQIVSYIVRLQNSTRQAIEDFKKANGYKHPIVGVHIRRTDKKREAAYHEVREYMQHAEEFYNKLTLKGEVVQRRIFVAADDPAVIVEIKSKFPGYMVISNQRSASEAFNLKSRNRSSALKGILTDIYLLAESDKLVCGFSSGFCRIAYELMQARDAEAGNDATHKAVSVDVQYFYAFVPFPPRRTIYCNKPVFANELQWSAPGVLLERPDVYASSLEARDKKYADGFNTGRIAGSSADANHMVFPRFKTVQTFSVVHYAVFNNSRQEV